MPLNVIQTAALLKISNRQVYDLIAHADLPAVRVHGDYRVHRDALFDWATATGHCLPRAFFSSDVDASHEVLLAALRSGTVARRPVPRTPRALAEVLLASLPLPPTAPLPVLAALIAARPMLGLHLISGEIALPRIREPLIVDAPPAVSLCVFERPPVPGLSATALFTVMAPTVRVHQRLLGALQTALHDRHVCEKSALGAPTEELVPVFREAGSAQIAAK